MKRLSDLGANLVIHPELEGGLQVIRHTLLHLGFPMQEVRRFAETVRREHYDVLVKSQGEQKLLRELLDASELLDISWRKIPENCPLVGKTQAETLMRIHTGANVVAIMREGRLLLNPSMDTVFLAADRLGLLANAEQVEAVDRMYFSDSEGIDAE